MTPHKVVSWMKRNIAPWLMYFAVLVITYGLMSAIPFPEGSSLSLLFRERPLLAVLFRERPLLSVLFREGPLLFECTALGAALFILSLIPAVFYNKELSDYDKARVKYIEVSAVLIATVGGIYALEKYQSTNVLSVRSALETRDSEIRKIYFSEDGERLMFLFTEPPTVTDEKSCEQVQKKIKPWARSAVLALVKPGNINTVPQWTSLHDLSHIMFDLSTSSSPGMRDINRGLFHAVDILYVVFDAYSANEMGVIDKKEYEMWAGYIDELGSNPYFLMAVMDGHEYGYTTRAFSKEIWQRFSENQRLHCFAAKLYPELTAPEDVWMDSWGKQRYPKNIKFKRRAGATAMRPVSK